MFFLLSCTINTTPQTNTIIQQDLQHINHHLQSIELFSNQLREAYTQNEMSTADELINRIKKENTSLQEQAEKLKENLKSKTVSPQ
jgi:hypothetical protein